MRLELSPNVHRHSDFAKWIRKEYVHDIPNTNRGDIIILHRLFILGVFYRTEMKQMIRVMRSRIEKSLVSFSTKSHVEAGEEGPPLSSFSSHKKGRAGLERIALP